MIVFLVASFFKKNQSALSSFRNISLSPRAIKTLKDVRAKTVTAELAHWKGSGNRTNKRTHTHKLSLSHTQSGNRMRAKRCKEIQVKFVKMGQPQYIHILNHKTIINSNHIFLTCKLLINIFNAHIHLLLTVSLHTAKHNRSNDEETKLKHLQPLVLNLSQHNKGR